MLHPSNREKKRKEILNNDLAVLPSHDKSCQGDLQQENYLGSQIKSTTKNIGAN